jgi:DNA-binding CsgD family transcriptional regulator
MNIPNTQMHWLTAVFIGIETILFFIQLFHYLNRPHDRQRLWYLLLLGLLIKFNVANGLFPDPAFPINIKLQIMIAYGFAYLMGAYFPFYFYKAYHLKSLRFYATWGVCLSLLLPYLIFDVILYALNGSLIPDRELGVIVPAIYGVIVLIAMLRAIMKKYKEGGHVLQYRCELLVWATVLPWELMSVFAFYPAPQWLRIGMGNLGWLTITLLQFGSAIKRNKAEHQKYKAMTAEIDPEDFDFNCTKFGFSQREKEVQELRLKGFDRQAIADKLFISKNTVKNHITHIYEKTGARSQEELITLLSVPAPNRKKE